MLTEGKTKRILTAHKGKQTIFLETKNILTAGNATKVETLSVAQAKTTQAVNVFTFLEAQGIPTAFIQQENKHTMLCHECEMIPVEFVMRRYAFGSFLKRNPEYKQNPPYQFEEIKCEFFHKYSVVLLPKEKKRLFLPEKEAQKIFVENQKEGALIFCDPIIHHNGTTGQTSVHPANKHVDKTSALLAIPNPFLQKEESKIVNRFMLPIFTALEKVWNTVSCENPITLVDMKIELGIKKSTGELVLADVVDNDSWRIWVNGDPKQQLDKQCFRNGENLEHIKNNYELVAELTSRFNKI